MIPNPLATMSILVIGEKDGLFPVLEETLLPEGYALFFSSKTEDYQKFLRHEPIRIVILQLNRQETEEYRLLKDIKSFDPLIETILIGPAVAPAKMIEAINLGAIDYLVEPLDRTALLDILEKIREKTLLRKETYKLEKKLTEKYFFEGMVSRNYYMLEVFSLIERMARYSISVLITGATGTGKEMVAQAIHNLSPRRTHKLIVFDCSAVPETLFESELFGYAKGAFTGAEKSKLGLFTEADKGTIFLDEIGEVPLAVQTKLLRVLEDRLIRPLGSNEATSIDVRLICATNRDLREDIKKGTFREDLFHRINVAEIHLPALKDRKEDIPLLCSFFLDRFSRRFKKSVRGISLRAKKVLLNYDWPGNVRELENFVERTVMLCRKQFIDIGDLPDNIIRWQDREETNEAPYPYAHLRLDDIEKKHIQEVMKTAKYNKLRAAKMLGMTRQALYRKLKKFNLPF